LNDLFDAVVLQASSMREDDQLAEQAEREHLHAEHQQQRRQQ
jgi:hypothetical protein